MKQTNRWIVMVLLVLAIIPLAACAGEEAQAEKEEPATIETVAGSEFNRVTLTAKAAERLDIQSEPVGQQAMEGSSMLVVPYSALLYGLKGETWVYVRNPGPDSLSFMRAPVTVERIEGDLAYLSDGPAVGTEVVTVGAAELLGTDTGVGK